MEPGLGGQEKSQTSRQRNQRKPVAMEPGLGGQEKPGRPSRLSRHATRRNGAWPWRPGKEALTRRATVAEGVAMEPGLGGQEKQPFSRCKTPRRYLSQWSLALAARKSFIRQPSQIVAFGSQWSLALAARKRTQRPGPPSRHSVVAMEPGLGGQEKAQEFLDWVF